MAVEPKFNQRPTRSEGYWSQPHPFHQNILGNPQELVRSEWLKAAQDQLQALEAQGLNGLTKSKPSHSRARSIKRKEKFLEKYAILFFSLMIKGNPISLQTIALKRSPYKQQIL